MYKVIVFAGTTEGYEISRWLSEKKVSVLSCVATEYGARALRESEYLKVQAGRLDQEEMKKLLKEERPELVVDATHPYAVEVTKNIKTACVCRLLATTSACCGAEAFMRTEPSMWNPREKPWLTWRGRREIFS